MAFISVEFGGEKTFGGYISVDGGKQFLLFDNQMIPIEEGYHHIAYSTISSSESKMNKANKVFGVMAGSSINYAIGAMGDRNAFEGDISETFEENTVMFLKIVSDKKGHVLALPNYRTEEYDDESMEKINNLYAEQLKELEAYERKDSVRVIVSFLLCVFLGYAGAHLFYNKNFKMGFLYLFTFGLCGIGWMVNSFQLFFAAIKALFVIIKGTVKDKNAEI